MPKPKLPLSQRKRGENISIYFPYNDLPLLREIEEGVLSGRFNSMSSAIIDACKQYLTGGKN